MEIRKHRAVAALPENSTREISRIYKKKTESDSITISSLKIFVRTNIFVNKYLLTNKIIFQTIKNNIRTI